MAQILLIDDEADLLRALTMILQSRGHQTTALSDALTASKLLEKEKFDLIISDIRMQPMDGLQFLEFLHQHHIETPVIMLTAYATLDIALQAIKKGAFDFITKPFKPESLIELAEQVLEQPVVNGSDISLEEAVHLQWLWHGVIARSHQMKDVCNCLKQIAPTDEPVLIVGEEGTGKHFMAEVIHALSPRSKKMFQRLDCAALNGKEVSPKIFEKSAGGTVLLENIDSLPAQTGQQLADIIQSQKKTSQVNKSIPQDVDVRFLTACRQIKESINWILPLTAFTVSLPPLRERINDILPLVSFFVHKHPGRFPADSWTISAEAYQMLAKHTWPRNVDELREIMDSAIAAANKPNLTALELPTLLGAKDNGEARTSSPSFKVEELRGRSFRDYVRRKQMEMKKGK
ncbi:MAG: response regulator [Kiritimatiellia bacterium]|nr:response regulator [Kiritimatiellia bacterium]